MQVLSKEFIQDLIQDQLNKPEVRSTHLKEDRWLLWTKRVLTEMLEVYRPLGDRDNDPTFIPYLVSRGIEFYNESGKLLYCHFEADTTEQRLASYSLKFPSKISMQLEFLRRDLGVKKQTLLANLIYTGLMIEFPDFIVGSQWRVKPLEYGLVFEPNKIYLRFSGKLATIAENNKLEDPFILCSVGDEKVKLRKDWLFSIVTV